MVLKKIQKERKLGVLGEKKNIFYSRTYRRLGKNLIGSILYLCVLVIPVLLLFIFNINRITRFMSERAVSIIGATFSGIPMYIRKDTFSLLGTIEFVELPTVYPEVSFVLLNFVAILGLAIFLNTGKRRGKPLSLYFSIMTLVQIINCIYFIFASNYFSYTTFQYSNLYIKQQIGIWISFIVMAGLITGFLGAKGLVYRVLGFLSILLYSFIFGIIRYIVFLYILQKFSIMYMALLFFVLGPFFDFLYFVGIYGAYMNKMIKLYNDESGRGEWLWS